MHNALAIFYHVQGIQPEIAMKHFQQARDCAIKGEYIELTLRSENNIGSIYFYNFEFEKALPYYHEIIELGRTMTPPPVEVSMAHVNTLECAVIAGHWQECQPIITEFDKVVAQIGVTNHSRNNFGRVMFVRRLAGAFAYLGLRQFDIARSEKRLAQELAPQLGIADISRIDYFDIIYDVIVNHADEKLRSWIANDQSEDKFVLNRGISLLISFGKLDQAQQVFDYMLKSYSDEQIRKNISSVYTRWHDDAIGTH